MSITPGPYQMKRVGHIGSMHPDHVIIDKHGHEIATVYREDNATAFRLLPELLEAAKKAVEAAKLMRMFSPSFQALEEAINDCEGRNI